VIRSHACTRIFMEAVISLLIAFMLSPICCSSTDHIYWSSSHSVSDLLPVNSERVQHKLWMRCNSESVLNDHWLVHEYGLHYEPILSELDMGLGWLPVVPNDSHILSGWALLHSHWILKVFVIILISLNQHRTISAWVRVLNVFSMTSAWLLNEFHVHCGWVLH